MEFYFLFCQDWGLDSGLCACYGRCPATWATPPALEFLEHIILLDLQHLFAYLITFRITKDYVSHINIYQNLYRKRY
jgi:hypothetical protein